MKRFVFWVILFAIIPFSLTAQVVLNNLQSALDMAKENNVQADISRLQYRISRVNFRNSLAGILPYASFNGRTDYNYALQTNLIPASFVGGPPDEYVEVQFGTRYNTSVTVDAGMPVISAAAWQDIRIARENQQMAAAQTEEQMFSLEKQVINTYYSLLLYQYNIRISEKFLAIQDTLLMTARSKNAQEMMDPVELNRIEVNRAMAFNSLTDSRTQYTIALTDLRILLQLEDTDSLLINDSITFHTDAEPAVTTVKSVGPSLQVQNYQTVISKSRMVKEYLGLVPKISVVFRYTEQAQRNEWNFFDSGQPWFGFGFLGLSLEFPILKGLTTWNGIQREKINYRIATLQKTAAENNDRKENIQLETRYDAAIEKEKSSLDAWRFSEKNLELSVIKYKEGLLNTDQLMNITRESLEARNRYLSVLYDKYVNAAIIRSKNQY